MPSQDFRFLTDAFARLGINPPPGFNPGQMSTSTAGTLSDIVSDPSGKASLDRARAQGALNIDAAKQRGVRPANPIKGFNISSTNPLGRGVTAPSIGPSNVRNIIPPTNVPRPPVPGIGGQPGIMNRLAQNFGRLQGIVPTALNPFASSVPTTKLGKLGSFLNPLSPKNRASLAGIGVGFIPGLADKDKAGLQTGFFMPGGPVLKTLSAIAAHDFNNPVGLTDKRIAELIEESKGIAGIGPNRHLKNAEGKYWAGKDWGYQSPESFNALFNANLPTSRPDTEDPVVPAPVVPDPVTTAPVVPGQQAGNFGAMETYMQLKEQAKTPEDYKMLDQLGMAIHQEKFGTPEMRMEKTIGTFNPLMAQMGLQQPTRAIKPDQEALVDRMDQQALKAQEFLRKLTKFNKKDEK